MERKEIEERVAKMLKNQNRFYEWGVDPDGVVEIEIDGDWKHDHLATDWLMGQIGFKKTNEDVTEEDGSDWYTSIHEFKFSTELDEFHKATNGEKFLI